MSDLHGCRVCLVLLTGLGDVVHGLPIVNALKRAGVAHLTWVAEPAPSWIVRPHPAVDEVVVYHKKRGWRGVAQLASDLRGRAFDVTLNLNIYFKSIWPTTLARAPRRIGFDRARSRDGVWLFANEHLRSRPRAHTQDMFLEFLEHLRIGAYTRTVPGARVRPGSVLRTDQDEPTAPLEWNITFTPEEFAAQHRHFAPLRDSPVVAIVPASANAKKDWFADRWSAVIDALAAQYGARALIVGGPSAREREIAHTIVRGCTSAPRVALADDVRRMMWLVAGSDLVIAPDTGPVHIARACEVPVVGLYGHTNPWRVGPYRKYEDLWIDRYTEPDGPPDPSNATPRDGRMERITVDDVMERVARAFEHYAVGRR
ncbi:MAG: glycosyltransferase family 9 protein [Longimicrobiales bacterium]